MSITLDNVRNSLTVPPEKELELFSAEGSCAAWRYLMLEAPVPVELRLLWTGRLPGQGVRMTGRSLQVCLHASSVQAWATNLGAAPALVRVGVVQSAERVTTNVFDVLMADDGEVGIPSFATHARLDTRSLDGGATARLELLDSGDDVIAANAPGQLVPLGRAAKLRTVCPVPHRVVFALSL